jgi:RNase adaptor protein for sRNA GlmZ degradation
MKERRVALTELLNDLTQKGIVLDEEYGNIEGQIARGELDAAEKELHDSIKIAKDVGFLTACDAKSLLHTYHESTRSHDLVGCDPEEG